MSYTRDLCPEPTECGSVRANERSADWGTIGGDARGSAGVSGFVTEGVAPIMSVLTVRWQRPSLRVALVAVAIAAGGFLGVFLARSAKR